jgi:hypothetical protein
MAVSFFFDHMPIYSLTGRFLFVIVADGRLFTTLFGFVGIGTCAILASAMLVRARATEARYVRIAEKGIL